MIWKNLFYSQKIKPEVKIICYKAFIRPILIYACPIWWNISPAYMEKIRLFERKCLRVCLNTYRSAHSDFKHYTSNKTLLDTAQINRIDMFIIKTIKNRFARLPYISENEFIWGCTFPNDKYYQETFKSGYIPPEAFLYLDAKSFIINEENIPIIYHKYRRATNKKIRYEPDLRTENNELRFCTNISTKDIKDINRENKYKYFWLDW